MNYYQFKVEWKMLNKGKRYTRDTAKFRTADRAERFLNHLQTSEPNCLECKLCRDTPELKVLSGV